MHSVSVQSNAITYCVDYYVELLGVLYILCRDQDAVWDAGVPQTNNAYVEEVRSYFRQSDFLPLTAALESFSRNYYFNFDAPVQLMLALSNDVEPDREALFRERKMIPDALFEKFLQDLAVFEERSGFQSFYQRHTAYYETLLKRFIQDCEKYSAHRWLFSRLKAGNEAQYCINLMLGITNGNFSATVGNRVYANICPYWETRFPGQIDYAFSPIYYTTLILHEFAHSIINPMTAACREQISRIDLEPYSKVLDALCYGDSLETLINETVIRALECLYVEEKFKEHCAAYVKEYEAEGYGKLRQTVEEIRTGTDMKAVIRIFEENRGAGSL